MYYQISDRLQHLENASGINDAFFAVTLTPDEWEVQKTRFGFPLYTGLENLKIHSCKAEIFAKYIFGSLYIPDRTHLLNTPLSLVYYVNEKCIAFVNENSLTDRIIGQMVHKYEDQEMTPEFFLYGFFSEFLDDDIELLEKYENKLFELEENALKGNIQNLLPRLLRARRELTRLRNYYEQMEDMARELEGNVKNYFNQENMQLLHLFGDRAERLQNMAQQAIEYCQTLRDFEQAQSDHKQNKTMRLLTVITSIFFPLTLITGWYGMNFSYMPELETRYGYLTVILISLGVILIEIVLLKKRKTL